MAEFGCPSGTGTSHRFDQTARQVRNVGHRRWLALRDVRAATRPANPRGNRWNIRQGFFLAALGFALHHNGEKHMTRSKLLGVTALILSSALASPVFALDAARDHAQKQMRVNSQA